MPGPPAFVACNSSSATRIPDDAADDHNDPAEQAALYDHQCAAGDLEACRNLGMFYAVGKGVSPDPKRSATTAVPMPKTSATPFISAR